MALREPPASAEFLVSFWTLYSQTHLKWNNNLKFAECPCNLMGHISLRERDAKACYHLMDHMTFSSCLWPALSYDCVFPLQLNSSNWNWERTVKTFVLESHLQLAEAPLRPVGAVVCWDPFKVLTFHMVPDTGWVWESHSMSKFAFLSKKLDSVYIEKKRNPGFLSDYSVIWEQPTVYALVFL